MKAQSPKKGGIKVENNIPAKNLWLGKILPCCTTHGNFFLAVITNSDKYHATIPFPTLETLNRNTSRTKKKLVHQRPES